MGEGPAAVRGWGRGRTVALAIALLIILGSLATAVAFERVADPLPGRNEYNLAAWELRHFPKKWLYKVGDLFRAESSLTEDQQLARFFELNRAIDDLERQLSDAQTRGEAADGAVDDALADAVAERRKLEAHVQATIEGRITAIAEREALQTRLPILPDVLWPPVDLEFTTAPRILAVSPRDRIELTATTLLSDGLSLAEIEAIERERAEGDGVSALAFPTGGVGAYPTIIAYRGDYRSTVEVAAHEWTHNYLAFRPLGLRYFKSNDLRTLNETVADLVGREIALAVVSEWPLPEEATPPAEPAAAPAISFGEELRALRGEVDDLLAAGKIEEAEALMEERRQFLADNGYFIRKINQAYFAYTNLYAGEAGSPAAVNPIGPKVDELRRRSASLGTFLKLVDGFTSVADLDAALVASADR